MVTKLTFKGDKPAKKRVKTKVVKSSEKKAETIDIERIETSWTSATTFGDLNGPLMITTYERSTDEADKLKGQPIALSYDELATTILRRNLSTSTNTISFPIEDINPNAYDAPIYKTEPNDVQNVFVAVSLSSLISTKVHPNKTNIALKSTNDKYLGVNAAGQLDCLSEAIGDSQIWEFERVIDNDIGVWFRIYNQDKTLSIDEEGNFTVSEESKDKSDLFVIRVQARNSKAGQKLIREHEEFKIVGSDPISYRVRNAAKSLQESGLEITPATLKRLRNAALDGKLNEQLIIERLKLKSDSRC